MSDIDRRRYVEVEDGLEVKTKATRRNPYRYYHESAVSELVKALREAHGAAVVPNHGPCEFCDILAHYKDLRD